MNFPTTISILALSGSGLVHAATILPASDDFSTGLGNWSTTIGGASWSSARETAEIPRGFGGAATQGIQLGSPMELASGGFTDVTIRFEAEWSSAMFGSRYSVEYSSDNGGNWDVLNEFIYDAAGVVITETVNAGLTDQALFRIVKGPNSNTGNGFLDVDNITITGTTVPEPSVALVAGWGLLLLGRRRRK